MTVIEVGEDSSQALSPFQLLQLKYFHVFLMVRNVISIFGVDFCSLKFFSNYSIKTKENDNLFKILKLHLFMYWGWGPNMHAMVGVRGQRKLVLSIPLVQHSFCVLCVYVCMHVCAHMYMLMHVCGSLEVDIKHLHQLLIHLSRQGLLLNSELGHLLGLAIQLAPGFASSASQVLGLQMAATPVQLLCDF